MRVHETDDRRVLRLLLHGGDVLDTLTLFENFEALFSLVARDEFVVQFGALFAAVVALDGIRQFRLNGHDRIRSRCC